MIQIKEYKLVVAAEGGTKFEQDVNSLISEGWQPSGGVAVISGEPEKSNDPKLLAMGYDIQSRFFMIQAMVR